MMQLSKILTSQAIHFIAGGDDHYESRSPVPFIKEMQERYGFVQVPRTLAELDLKTGISFFKGYYHGKILDKVQIYQNGILCESQNDNSIANEFLSEMLAWVAEKYQVQAPKVTAQAYLSQLEITVPFDLSEKFKAFSDVGKIICGLVRSYGQDAEDFGMSAIKMHYDIAGKPYPRAPEFSFERRAEHPHSSNLYFTSAPLKTEDHFTVLAALEKALT